MCTGACVTNWYLVCPLCYWGLTINGWLVVSKPDPLSARLADSSVFLSLFSIFIISCPHCIQEISFRAGGWRLLCSVLSHASSLRVGHGWQRQEWDGRQGGKVPDRLLVVGRTWLCYSYHKLLRLPGGCFLSLVLLCFGLPGISRLNLFIFNFVYFVPLARSVLLSATSPTGAWRVFLSYFGLFFFVHHVDFLFLSLI